MGAIGPQYVQNGLIPTPNHMRKPFRRVYLLSSVI